MPAPAPRTAKARRDLLDLRAARAPGEPEETEGSQESRALKGHWERWAPLDLQDNLALRDPVDSLFRGQQDLQGRKETLEPVVQLDKWVFLDPRGPPAEMAPRDHGVFLEILDLRDHKDLPDLPELQEHQELQGLVGQQGPKVTKDFRVPPAPRERGASEGTSNHRQPSEPSPDRCASSSSRATCPATTPS